MADEMPAPLSDAEIAEIAERAAKATPGSWYRYPNGSAWDGVWSGAASLVVANTEHDSDLDFIAAARTDIPRLLATLAARDARLAALAALLDEAAREVYDYELRHEALESECAAMREIVAVVARMDDSWFADVETDPDDVPQTNPCPHCHADMSHYDAQHATRCPVTRARALLATPTTGATPA